jgi:tetratricopeptide (TPR) repeat protein
MNSMHLTKISSRLLIFASLLGCRFLGQDAGTELATQARKELFAARYENAAKSYLRLVAEQPASGDAWYGLVRAELEAHQAKEAYSAANEAIQKVPQTAGAQTAAGIAAWRKGELTEAEGYFRAALKLNPDYPGALRGLATIYTSLSKFRTARDLRLRAWHQSPDDPELMLAHANTLKGADHIAALEAILHLLDRDTEQARNLRVHIANDRAIGDTKVRRLVSPYQNSTIKLFWIMDGPSQRRGLGVRVQLNGKQNTRLLVDTGASGIAISPKVAERAGLKAVSGESSETKGVGDGKTQSTVAYLASEVRVGDVTFADYPIQVFRSAQSADHDGLIGADVFQRFIVKIDVAHLAMGLETRPQAAPEDSDEPVDGSDTLLAGFHRVLRFGNHLGLPTSINGSRNVLFMVDSGSSINLIDTESAKKFAYAAEDPRVVVQGVQGKVNKVSIADRVTLTFAGLRQENPNLIAIGLDRLSDDMGVQFAGVLGMPVLSQLTVTIDYREGTVRFEYKKP